MLPPTPAEHPVPAEDHPLVSVYIARYRTPVQAGPPGNQP